MRWAPKRLPGKNLECIVALGDAGASVSAVSDGMLTPLYSVMEAYRPLGQYESAVYVTTAELPTDAPEWWRRMEAGKHSGLDEDPAVLAGKHVLHQAIALAVHAGFSRIRIRLRTDAPDARLRRALDSLVRPLRHRRVSVTGCAPFPEE